MYMFICIHVYIHIYVGIARIVCRIFEVAEKKNLIFRSSNIHAEINKSVHKCITNCFSPRALINTYSSIILLHLILPSFCEFLQSFHSLRFCCLHSRALTFHNHCCCCLKTYIFLICTLLHCSYVFVISPYFFVVFYLMLFGVFG